MGLMHVLESPLLPLAILAGALAGCVVVLAIRGRISAAAAARARVRRRLNG